MEDRSRNNSSWPLYLAGVLLFLGLSTLMLWNIELPYLAWSTGPVSDAADAIVIEGQPTFDPEGELLMLTVLSQDVNIFEALIAGLDPDIDLVRKENVRSPDESDEEYRTRVLAQMDDSQSRAISVALQELGFELVPRDVIVIEIIVGLPADAVLEPGDSINTVNGIEIVRSADVPAALDGLKPGDTVTLGITREGTKQQVELVLAARDDDPDAPIMGIVVRELTDPPFPVTIEAGNVGGPSAGMMHTLAIIDTLTPGEMTKGHVIAGTGTIQLDGSVGNIGGIRQKVAGAEAAGATIILVPAGNYEEALTADYEDIEIVPVATLQEALAYLEGLDPA
ncbi:MAG: PDZ domain-containing protein [Acidimicrobiia bacterium]|nr:PDZ domain-containing protein [Acidimicrobiia bacterium]